MYIIKKIEPSEYISPASYWSGDRFTSFLLLAKRYCSAEEAEKDLTAAQQYSYVIVKVSEIFE